MRRFLMPRYCGFCLEEVKVKLGDTAKYECCGRVHYEQSLDSYYDGKKKYEDSFVEESKCLTP